MQAIEKVSWTATYRNTATGDHYRLAMGEERARNQGEARELAWRHVRTVAALKGWCEFDIRVTSVG